jgi:hypothetical protein
MPESLNHPYKHCTFHTQTSVYLDEPAASIMVIDDFVTDHECDALITRVKDNLQVTATDCLH